jgi:hypothetical protein
MVLLPKETRSQFIANFTRMDCVYRLLFLFDYLHTRVALMGINYVFGMHEIFLAIREFHSNPMLCVGLIVLIGRSCEGARLLHLIVRA